jgi:hypothetical protein
VLQLERNIATSIQPIVKEGVSYVGLINKNGRLDKMICKENLPLSKDKKDMFSHPLWLPAVAKLMECQ